MSSPVEILNGPVNALLDQLEGKVRDPRPLLLAIGEDMVETTKQRFGSATAPDGTPWKPNTRATLEAYIMRRGGFSQKTGKINAKGKTLAMSKRPLQGLTGDLARQFSSHLEDGAVVVGSSMRYARMQQQGGTKAMFPHLWGDIPARPMLPVTPGGQLYPAAESRIVQLLQLYLTI